MPYRIVRPTDFLVPTTATSVPPGSGLSCNVPLADDYPISELRNHKLFRTTRTTGTSGTPRFVWDRGAAGTLDSIYIGNANFPQFDLVGSSDGINFTTTLASNALITKNKRTGRRHKFLLSTGNWTGSQPRYIGLAPEGTPDASATHYELAQWTLHSGSLLLGDYANPELRWTPFWPSTRIDLQGGAEEVVEDGRAFLETEIYSPYFLRGSVQTVQDELLDLLHAAGPGGHFIIYENLGQDWQAYLVQRKESIFPVVEQVSTFAASLTMREVV